MSATLGSDSGELSGMRRRVYGSERGSGGNGQGRGVGVGPGIVKAAAASVSARSANTYSQCITQRARMLQRTVAPTALGFSVASTVWLSAWLRFDFSVWSLVAVPLLATLVTLASLLPLLHFSENPALLPSLPAHLLSALVSGLFVKATLISHADWLPFGSNFIILPDRKYGARFLNESFVYSLNLLFWLSLLYPVALHFKLFANTILSLDSVSVITFRSLHRQWGPKLKAVIPSILGKSLRIAILYSLTFHFFFVVMLRGIMYRTVAFLVSFSMFTSISTKPNPSSHIYFFDFSCLAESVATTTFIIALWQITAASISALYSLPLDPSTIASRFPDLLAILTSDVSVPAGSRTPYANTLAYLDLLAVARTNARLREDVFNGSGTAGAGAVETWTVLAAACLRPVETLRGELARLQAVRAEVYAGSAGRRGGSGGVKGGAPLGGLPASGTLSPVKKARLLTGAVKPSPGKKSVWEALQDPSATVPDLGGAVGATAVKNGDVKVPDLLAAGGGLYKKQDASTKPKSAEPAVGLIEYLLILIGAIKKDGKKESGRGKGASLEGMGKVTQKAFVDSEVLSLAVESVSRLLIAATKEDKYGFVQRSIPDVLECLLHCLIAIETHMTNPPGMADFPVSSSMILASEGLHGQIVYKEPLAAVHILQTNIYYITSRLGDHLARYNFDPAVSGKLKRFVECVE